MKRTIRRRARDFFCSIPLQHIRCVPSIISNVENWRALIFNCIGFMDSSETYIFRDGIKIKTQGGVEARNIVSIFMEKAYGEIIDNSVIIDIGAHIGVYTIFTASKSKNISVYAYEPMPSSFNLLLENAEVNKLQNIRAFNLGVCAKKEKIKLYIADISFLHSLYGNNTMKYIEIECVSLKDIFVDNEIDHCDILKLDCEGAEYEILFNTPDEYLCKIKKICLEYHDQGANKQFNIKKLISFLEKRCFRIVKITKYPKGVWLEKLG